MCYRKFFVANFGERKNTRQAMLILVGKAGTEDMLKKRCGLNWSKIVEKYSKTSK